MSSGPLLTILALPLTWMSSAYEQWRQDREWLTKRQDTEVRLAVFEGRYNVLVANTREVQSANRAAKHEILHHMQMFHDVCAQRDGLFEDVAALRELLTRIRAWDMMDVADDGTFWREQIDIALEAHDGIKSTFKRPIR